jgi:uncharacterized membrane protein YccF (DUF307 family)
MKTIGNILWHVPFCGFVSAFLVYGFGVLLTATVIAAPIGLGCMEFGKFLMAPFGNTMINRKDIDRPKNSLWSTYSNVVTAVYLPFGILLAGLSALQAALLAVTIVGIPLAIIVAKSLGTYLNPVNKKCVSIAVANEIEQRKAKEKVDHMLSK